MDSNQSGSCNEHDYSSPVEIPLDSIKTETLDEDGYQYLESISQSSIAKEDQTVNSYSHHLDDKPKQSKRKQPTKPCILLPRPIKPKIEPPRPPPILPRNTIGPPPNCKGVLIVQDVKYCTMYMPKGGNKGTVSSPVPVQTFPVGSINNPISISSNLVSPNVSSTHQSPLTGPEVPDFVASGVNEAGCSQASNVVVPISSPEVRGVNRSPAYTSLHKAQVLVNLKLPCYWFSALENNGINIMLISYGTEKAIQRRMYVSCDGDVDISVHCKPLPEFYVQEIIEKAGTSVQLTSTSVMKFSDWIIKLVGLLRDFQICVGLEDALMNQQLEDKETEDLEVDTNPYQEKRYTRTLRSKNCLRLVEQSRRKCIECSKSFHRAKKIANSITSPKKIKVSSLEETFSTDISTDPSIDKRLKLSSPYTALRPGFTGKKKGRKPRKRIVKSQKESGT